MEVAPLHTMFTLFKLLYLHCVNSMDGALMPFYDWNGLMGFGANCWMECMGEWMDGYPLGCYDYWDTWGAFLKAFVARNDPCTPLRR